MVIENIHSMINLSMEKKKYLEELLDLATIQEEMIIKEEVEEKTFIKDRYMNESY